MSNDSFSSLLIAIYGAPLRPELWREALAQLCHEASIPQAALLEHRNDQNSHRILAHAGDGISEGGRIYEKDYWPFDEWTKRLPKQLPSGRVLRGQELWPERDLRRSVFFNEFLLKYDVCEMACIGAHSGPGEFEGLSVYRGPGDAPFSEDQLAYLERLAPHLEIACMTRRRLIELESRNRQLEAAFHLAQSAFLFVDKDGRVTLANKAAVNILGGRSGLILKNSRLEAEGVRENARLRALIAQSISRDSGGRFTRGGSLVIPRAGRRPLYVFIASAPEEPCLGQAGAAIVSLSDPERKPQVSSRLLRELFHFTPAESRLTAALLNGHSLTESGESLGVGRETVRSQLKSILHKTGARRQSELLQVLTSLNPPPHEGP